MSEYTYGQLYVLKSIFEFFSDHKSIDAVKQLRYAEHYSHEKLGRMKTLQMATTSKNTKKDLHIIAYLSMYKARLNNK